MDFYSAVQTQVAVPSYFSSKQLLPLSFALHTCVLGDLGSEGRASRKINLPFRRNLGFWVYNIMVVPGGMFVDCPD